MKIPGKRIRFRDPTTGEIVDSLLLLDGSIDTALEKYLDAHPESTVLDGSVTYSKFTESLQSQMKLITLSELETVGEGVYKLGTVDVTEPINLPRLLNRGIIIVDSVFNIDTSILFPPYNENQYFGLPSFVGCTFNNVHGSRVLFSSGVQIVGSRFTGCNFNNVDMAESNYNQDFNFVNCYIRSYQTFLKSTTTTQARFVNCDVEAESAQIISCGKAHLYFSGTYEGNDSGSEYFVKATYGSITFDSCWLESVKILDLTGGTAANEHTHLNFTGCEMLISQTPQVNITNAQYVHLLIEGNNLSPANSSALFVNKQPSEFYSIHGAFISNASGYVRPIGGVDADDRDLATLKDINDHFLHYECTLSATQITDGGIDLENIPVGQYLIFVSRGGGRIAQQGMAVWAIGGSIESDTNAFAVSLISSSDAYISHVVLTPTKSTASDKTFNINVNMDTTSYAALVHVALLKMY